MVNKKRLLFDNQIFFAETHCFSAIICLFYEEQEKNHRFHAVFQGSNPNQAPRMQGA